MESSRVLGEVRVTAKSHRQRPVGEQPPDRAEVGRISLEELVQRFSEIPQLGVGHIDGVSQRVDSGAVNHGDHRNGRVRQARVSRVPGFPEGKKEFRAPSGTPGHKAPPGLARSRSVGLPGSSREGCR